MVGDLHYIMWEYPSDCPEPPPQFPKSALQYEQGQYEQSVPQFLGTANVIQLGDKVSTAVYNGIHGKESQQK